MTERSSSFLSNIQVPVIPYGSLVRAWTMTVVNAVCPSAGAWQVTDHTPGSSEAYGAKESKPLMCVSQAKLPLASAFTVPSAKLRPSGRVDQQLISSKASHPLPRMVTMGFSASTDEGVTLM